MAEAIDPLHRMASVSRIVGLGRSEIYRRIKAGTFPVGVKLGVRSRAWRESDLKRYIGSLPTARPGKQS